MSKATRHPCRACAIVPILGCVYAAVLGPLYDYTNGYNRPIVNAQPGVPNRIFWPAMAAVTVFLVLRNQVRLGRLTVPRHIICLLVYVAFAGASVLWAFKPAISLTRYVQQVMVISSIVLPAMLAGRTAVLVRGLFLCFALGAFINLFFIFNDARSAIKILGGYPGYFLGKNYLGEFAAAALLLALYETLHDGWRRAFGIVVVIVAITLLLLSDSKTAFGLALICPVLAGITLTIKKMTGVSAAILLLSIPLCYIVLSSASNFNADRISYMLYGDSSFTGRTVIWGFAEREIERKPFVGWGYQSFWLVGVDAPSVVDAPGWVKMMPNAHNGYNDAQLELGYIGFTLLLICIISTLHAIGRVAASDFALGWLLLSLALYIICYNFLESFWMRGFEFLWVTFLIVVAEAARFLQPLQRLKAAHASSSPRRPLTLRAEP
jgi:exopolysaccharide production protein ExoQ